MSVLYVTSFIFNLPLIFMMSFNFLSTSWVPVVLSRNGSTSGRLVGGEVLGLHKLPTGEQNAKLIIETTPGRDGKPRRDESCSTGH